MKLLSPLKGNNVTLLKTFQTSKLIEDWEKDFSIDITSEIGQHDRIYLYQCNETKVKFFMPLDIYGSENLYQQLENTDWYYLPSKWEHNVAIEDLTQCKKILEVGCGRGAFVQRLCQELHLDAQGIEINNSAVEFAISQNILVSQQDVNNLAQEQPEYFDAVCTFQVLEHVAEPLSFLNSLVSLISSGGKLIISVPNGETFTRFLEKDLLDAPPHHMTQWCDRTFESLTAIFPLKLLHCKLEPLANYHVNWYAKAQASRLTKNVFISNLLYGLAKYSLVPILIKYPKIRNKIIGHTIYVCFEKI